MAKAKKKKSLFNKISEFFKGVKLETKKISWPSKQKLLKFSIATLVFMIFICLFFVATDLLIALISYVNKVFKPYY